MAKTTTKPAAGSAVYDAGAIGAPRRVSAQAALAEECRASGSHAATRCGRGSAYADFLEQVLGEEVAAKTAKNVSMRTAMARFPFVKPLETFDFAYQPSIDKRQVQTLASCHYIEHGDNVIVLGPPGVGKTHLAVSLSIKGDRGRLPRPLHVGGTVDRDLDQALAEGRLDESSSSTRRRGS